VRAAVVVYVASAFAFQPVVGQARPGGESQRLRDAAERESRGDLEGAEGVLRGLLDSDPSSSGALFALERVLRAQGRPADILSVADAFLEREPESSGVRYLKLRVLMEVDSLEALRAETRLWVSMDPTQELPYREAARVYERAFGAERALELLSEGRRATGRSEALALEVGDLHARMGDLEGAAHEWALAVGRDPADAPAVAGRVRDLPGGAAETARSMVRTLGASGESAQRRAGARLALELGLGAEALELSRGVAGELSGRERAAFLSDVARRELGDVAPTSGDRRQLGLRAVEVALAAADTAAALEAQRRVVESYSRGSADRRRATARAISLESTQADSARLHRLLASFRQEFPNAPELDALVAGAASVLLGRGDAQGAASLLEGVDGPRSALERAYLLLETGAIEVGRQSLLRAVTGLPPSEATSVIQFAGLLGRVSPPAARALADAGVTAHRGEPARAARGLAEAVGRVADGERAALLAEAARMADRGGEPEVGAFIRETLLEAHPDAPEVGEASLALARHRARSAAGVEEAIRILPDARMELERLRRLGS
jgi:tetratricopeptide (TPR) repeat protein